MANDQDTHNGIETEIGHIRTDVKADEQKAGSWVKAHVVWGIGLGCFIAGAIAGHFVR